MPRMFYKQTPEHVAKRLASRRTKGANIMMEYSARSLEQLADHLYGLGQRARASIRNDEKAFKRI